ncbi:hypothetical protein T4D_6890 [Trichinella pseudospiralis]|uniref:Uncharacterized protein n=1 Tax=Trichinella pseudospiralis TaxID=6337 RepID=A0A0V1FJ58_TRIPS|nr:hypothetical protein T4D_6890 [Trichinella pseudospiralis]
MKQAQQNRKSLPRTSGNQSLSIVAEISQWYMPSLPIYALDDVCSIAYCINDKHCRDQIT